MEVPGAAAGALGGEQEEEIAAGALGAEEEEAEDAEDAEEAAEEEVEEEAEEVEDVPDVEETLNMSDAALASTRLGSIELTNTLGVRTTTSVGHHPHASHRHEHPGRPAAHRGRRWLVPAVRQDRPGHAGPRAPGSRPR